MEDIIKEYIETECSIQYLSKKYHKAPMKISNAIKEAGYSVVNRQNLIKIDENIFDSIDTEEKAYWLGFLFADGCICKRDFSFELSLCEKDKNHLEKFNNFVKHTKNIKEKIVKLNGKEFKAYRSAFNSKHFWLTLNSYGCTPRKSLTLEFPEITIFKNKDLIRHFIRGYFDGDGCIVNRKKKDSLNSLIIDICGTIKFLTSLQNNDIIEKNNKITLNRNVPHFRYCGMTAFMFCKWLYEDATIYLERKYNLYKEYCRLCEKSHKLLESKIGEDCDVNTEQTIDITKGSIAA